MAISLKPPRVTKCNGHILAAFNRVFSDCGQKANL